jgi:hypothetical protein
MLPAQRNKVDISKLTEEEQKLFRLYGKLPAHKSVISKVQKDRKFFDSGDYAMSKAGKAPQNSVGTAIPNPENIPHASPSPLLNTAAAASPGLTPSGSTGSGNSLTSPIRENSNPIFSPSHLSQEESAPELAETAASTTTSTETSDTSAAKADAGPVAADEKDVEM